MAKIVVVGSYIVDLISRAPHLPKPGETVLGGPFMMCSGGKGGNQATAAARSGSEVTFITKIGQDVFGSYATQHFSNENVDTRHMKVDPSLATGTALIAVDDNSENSIVVSLGACGSLTGAEIAEAEEEIKNAAIVLIQLETSIEAVVATVALAQKHQVPVILNPAPYHEFPREILSGVKYITPNETEAFELSGIEVKDENSALLAAKKIRETGVNTVIITMGKKGAFLYDGVGSGHFTPSYKVEAIDTTGAGDAFNGGFAHALGAGYSLEAAVRFGSVVAALSVTKMGTSQSMPNKQEIEAFVSDRGITF